MPCLRTTSQGLCLGQASALSKEMTSLVCGLKSARCRGQVLHDQQLPLPEQRKLGHRPERVGLCGKGRTQAAACLETLLSWQVAGTFSGETEAELLPHC